MKRIMVAGTDTDIGKTHVSAALLAKARLNGGNPIGLKPVAAGVDYRDGKAYSDDAARLALGAGFDGPLEAINPYLFEPPIAPHVAAQQVGIELSARELASWAERQAAHYSHALLEGAGGWRVPLNEQECFSDIARYLQWDVVLVVGMRLGCISHALLTAEAIRSDGLNLAGWVANRVDPNQAVFEQNLETLKKRLSAPLLGVVDYSDQPFEQVAEQLRWPE